MRLRGLRFGKSLGRRGREDAQEPPKPRIALEERARIYRCCQLGIRDEVRQVAFQAGQLNGDSAQPLYFIVDVGLASGRIAAAAASFLGGQRKRDRLDQVVDLRISARSPMRDQCVLRKQGIPRRWRCQLLKRRPSYPPSSLEFLLNLLDQLGRYVRPCAPGRPAPRPIAAAGQHVPRRFDPQLFLDLLDHHGDVAKAQKQSWNDVAAQDAASWDSQREADFAKPPLPRDFRFEVPSLPPGAYFRGIKQIFDLNVDVVGLGLDRLRFRSRGPEIEIGLVVADEIPGVRIPRMFDGDTICVEDADGFDDHMLYCHGETKPSRAC